MNEYRAHLVALSLAIFGPLINIILDLKQPAAPPGMYFYWATILILYIIILLPFTYKSRLTLLKLIPLGITVEDFFSNLWRSLFFNQNFLPFDNWYTQHFPFLGSLGNPIPYLLIPQWYIVVFLLYFLITIFQYRKFLMKTFHFKIS